MKVLLVALALGLAVLATASAQLADDPPLLDWEIVSRRPHDTEAWTQGLELDAAGRLYESTGRLGQSSVREVDPVTGIVVRARDLPPYLYGEGLTIVADRLVQLTWRAGLALVRDHETLELLDIFSYDGQGWGLCFDGGRLVMSDGSDRLTFRDPGTFEATASVGVTLGGAPLAQLNELECVDGVVWANVYQSDLVVRIDPVDGRVTGILDLAGVIEPHPAETRDGAVLNGIAHVAATGTFLVTGKEWPELIEIAVLEPSADEGDRPR